MEIRVVKDSISKAELKAIAEGQFGDFVKAVVDVKRGIMVIGGELHADEEAILLGQESQQGDLWGINIYPQKSGEDRIEFNSMINIRPSQENKSRGVENPAVRDEIRAAVDKLIV